MNTTGSMNLLKGDFVYRDQPTLEIADSAGSLLKTKQGHQLIDLQASSGAAILGYDRSILDDALKLTWPIGKPQFCESTNRQILADLLCNLIMDNYCTQGKVAFDLGGAQAIEQALKIVFSQSDQLPTLLTIDGSYHGRSLFTSNLSASSRYHLGVHTYANHMRLPNPCLIAHRENIDIKAASQIAINQVTAMFEDESYGLINASNAPIILLYESLQNVSGMLDIPADYLQTLETLVRHQKWRSNQAKEQWFSGICIADEIFTGLYRAGHLFHAYSKSLTPDIIVFSKGLTNAILPLSCIWLSDKSMLAQGYKPGIHSSTYINNELAFAVARVVLDRLKQMHLPNNLGERFSEALYGGVIKKSQCFAFGNILKIDLKSPDMLTRAKHYFHHLQPTSVLFAFTGLAKTALILHPPYTISEKEFNTATTIIRSGLEGL